MKAKNEWQEYPHRSMFETDCKPIICRVAPSEYGVQLEWIDKMQNSVYTAEITDVESGETVSRALLSDGVIDGLETLHDYKVVIVRDDGVKSSPRLFYTASVPGTVINYLHPKDKTYSYSGSFLGSPSLIKLESGVLLASMDVFGANAGQNQSFLYRSDDNGTSWYYVCDLYPLFWGNMFYHNGRLYILGCSTEFGDIIIGASDDEGKSWTMPTRLFVGSSTVSYGWQQAAMPIVEYNKRLYFAVEYAGHGIETGASVLSVPSDSDLLDPSGWHCSAPVAPRNTAVDIHHVNASLPNTFGVAEGSLLINRQNELVCLMRINTSLRSGEAFEACFKVNTDDPDAPMEFDSFVAMPSGYNSKTFIRYDKVSDTYIALGNLCFENGKWLGRTVLALMTSKDTVNWETKKRLFDYSDCPVNDLGIQYPFFIFDGDDMLLQLRTSMNKSDNFHNSNYSTFHIIKDFRSLL